KIFARPFLSLTSNLLRHPPRPSSLLLRQGNEFRLPGNPAEARGAPIVLGLFDAFARPRNEVPPQVSFAQARAAEKDRLRWTGRTDFDIFTSRKDGNLAWRDFAPADMDRCVDDVDRALVVLRRQHETRT